MENTILYLSAALKYVPDLMQVAATAEAAFAAVSAHVSQTMAELELMQRENRNPTGEEWAALEARCAPLRAELHDEKPAVPAAIVEESKVATDDALPAAEPAATEKAPPAETQAAAAASEKASDPAG